MQAFTRNAVSPTQSNRKGSAVETRTLWVESAWQLLQSDEIVNRGVPETYVWLLFPDLVPGHCVAATGWQEMRLQVQEPLAARSSGGVANDDWAAISSGQLTKASE